MIMRKVYLLFALLSSLCGYAQKKVRTFGPKDNLDYEYVNALKGVKYADFGLNEAQEKYLIAHPESADIQTINAFVSSLQEKLGVTTVVTNEQRDEMRKIARSVCDVVYCGIDIGDFKSDFMAIGKVPMTVKFTYCDSSVYYVQMVIRVDGNTNIYKKMKKEFSYILPEKGYDAKFKKQLEQNPIVSKEPGNSSYEGIYKLFDSDGPTAHIVKIVQIETGLNLVNVSGGYFADDWKSGEVIGILHPTMSDGDFELEGWDSMKWRYKTTVVFPNKNSFQLTRRNGKIYKYVRIK